MKQYIKWWKRVHTEFIRNKTRREISETTWRECLKWVQTKNAELQMNDEFDRRLLELEQIVAEELGSE